MARIWEFSGGGSGILWAGQWLESYYYSKNSLVGNFGDLFVCLESHLSTEENEPGVGAQWETVWARTVDMLTGDQKAGLDANPSINGMNPVAVTTDLRFPTVGEKGALAGTSGTPGDANRYVTDLDYRLSDARTPVAHQLDSSLYHTVSGLTPGHFLRASASDAFGFGAIQVSDLPSGINADTLDLYHASAFLLEEDHTVLLHDAMGIDADMVDGYDAAAFVLVADHTTLAHNALGIDADTVDGSHASAFSLSGHTHAHADTTGKTANDHHNQSHVLTGTDHSAAGLTPGHVLRASAADAFGFAALQTGDIPDLSSIYSVTGHAHSHASTTGQTANDHHNQSHVLTGTDHTYSGLTPGHYLRASAADAAGFAAIQSGDLPDLSGIYAIVAHNHDLTYAPIAKGVTNGDSHDHYEGDGAQINHTTLSNIGTNAHSAIDTFIGSKAQASGLASLDVNTRLVETAQKLYESGGQVLTAGAIADGQYLKRSGTTYAGDALTAADVAAGTFPGTSYTIPGSLTLQTENPVVNVITNDSGVTGTVGFIFGTNPSNNHKWAAVAYGTNYTLATSADDFALQYYNGASWVIPFWLEKTGDVGFGTTLPAARVHIYGNVTGATNPVLLVRQDHASNTGALIKGVHDGTGYLLDLYNGATGRLRCTYDGILDVYTGFRINGAAAAGKFLKGNGTNFVGADFIEPPSISVDGGGSVITTGAKGWWYVPYDCVITGWIASGLPAGAIVWDIWADTYANGIPTSAAKSICASDKPTITATNSQAQGSSLTGWTTSLSAGTWLRWNVDSVSTMTWASCMLTVKRV